MDSLGAMIAKELGSIGWDKLMPAGSAPLVGDTRKWVVHAMSKAIWQFVIDRNSVLLVANGSFVNNTNLPPSGSPYTQPTIGVRLSGWIAVPSHKKLYDILLPWTTGDMSDASVVWVDTFQRIFSDWLGVLEIVAGQDGETPLPLVPAGTFNATPPYFHSINGSTLLKNKFVPPRELDPPENYPTRCEVQPQQGMGSPPPDTGVADAKLAMVSRWNLEEAKAVKARDLVPKEDDSEAILAFKMRWDRKVRDLRAQKKTLQENPVVDPDELKAVDESIDAVYADCLKEIDATPPQTGKVYEEASYPACVARIELIEYEKELAKLPAVSSASVPEKVPAGSTDKDAPEIGVASTMEPNPTAYGFPKGATWYEIRPALTFPLFETHARACAQELVSTAPTTVVDAWEIIGKYITLCLNTALPTAGGGTGYAYGLPANPWTGSIVVMSARWA